MDISKQLKKIEAAIDTDLAKIDDAESRLDAGDVIVSQVLENLRKRLQASKDEIHTFLADQETQEHHGQHVDHDDPPK